MTWTVEIVTVTCTPDQHDGQWIRMRRCGLLDRRPALSQPEIERIVDLMFDDLRSRLAERQMTLEVSQEARRFTAQQGFDPVYGARPLRRFIAREVETRIGRALLAGDVRDGAVIRVEYTDGDLVVGYENPA